MSEASKTATDAGSGQMTVAEAEEQLARLCRPLAASGGVRACVAELVAAAVMTSVGVGLRLFAEPGAAPRLVAVACALVVAARVALPVLLLRNGRAGKAGAEPGWVAAARVHRGSLPGRVPAATLTAVDRYLPVLSRHYGSTHAHLYVGPCAGEGEHTPVCSSVGLFAPPRGGRHLLVITGEHVAAEPALAAACLAHEAGHVSRWTSRAFVVLHGMRRAGWGWSVVGAVGAGFGWLGLLVAAAVFQVSSLLLVWAVEVVCDRAAMRVVGRTAYREALLRLVEMTKSFKRERPRWRRTLRVWLLWLAGPSHPPLRLRRALILRPAHDRPSAGHWSIR